MKHIRTTLGGGMEAIGDNGQWQHVPKSAADEIAKLSAASRDVVLAYQEANPFRQADMHPEKCGCLRCEIDRLDYVSDSYK